MFRESDGFDFRVSWRRWAASLAFCSTREPIKIAGGNYSAQYNNVFAANNRLTNYYSMRAREDLNIDTRTATEYGVVRTYFDAVFTWTTGNYVGTGSGTGPTGDSISRIICRAMT